MEKQLIPNLRFSEFKGNWKSIKIGNIGKPSMCKRIMKDQTLNVGDIPFYKIGTFGKEADAYIANDLYEEYKTKFSFPKKGDILISASGTIGRTVIYDGKPAYFQDSNIVWIANNEEKVLNKLLVYLYENVRWTTENTTIARLYNDNLKSINITIPTLPEQQKIASFLKDVDDKITKLTKKKDLLEQYKKGIMQKIFNRELRFKDDDGNEFPQWKKKKIKDLGFYISDGNYGEMYPKSSQMKKMGVPFIRANNIKNLNLVWDDMKYIDEDLHSVLLSGHIETNDILITTRGEIGMLAFVKEEFKGANINAQICLLRCNESMISKYLLYSLSHRDCQNQFRSLQTGSALKQLPKKSLGEIKVLYPCINEQTKIANFLSDIDLKIEVLNTKIENTKAFKKGLLQQMFV